MSKAWVAISWAVWWLLPERAQAHVQDAPGWTFNVWLLAILALACTLYTRGALHIGSSRRRLENGAFALSMLTLIVALLSPLDGLSDYSFAAHMLQHELLMLLAAPLLVLSRPLPVYLRALPASVRNQASSGLRSPLAVRAFRILSAPTVALIVHGLVRWLWHLPSWFEAALASEWVHGVQHASFFLTALLFWWGIVQGRYGRAGYGAAFVFVLLTAMHTGALGALLAFSTQGWYPTYALRGAEFALDVVDDQQTAGQIMWVAAGVWMMLLALALLLAWLGEARRRAQRGTVATLLRERGAR